MAVMETEIVKDEPVKIVPHIDQVKLYDYGYEKSGNVKGDPDVYASCLQRILNGDLVENDYIGFTDHERKERIEHFPISRTRNHKVSPGLCGARFLRARP